MDNKQGYVVEKDWSSRLLESLLRKHKETSRNPKYVDEMEVKC
jgi:hypothetical protein